MAGEEQAEFMAAFIGAVQNMKIQSLPSTKLSKFGGNPRKLGDPLLREWLVECEAYCRQMGLEGDAKAAALLDHLVGEAREEALCSPKADLSDYEKLISVLKKRFGPLETVNSLHNEFHQRVRSDGETLSEFTRDLIRIYSRMMEAAKPDERQALEQLKETSLKQQLKMGCNNDGVRVGVAQLEMLRPKITFNELRDEILTLYPDVRDASTTSKRARARDVNSASATISNSVSEPTIQDLIRRQDSFEREIRTFMTTLQGGINTGGRGQGASFRCYGCNQWGHRVRDCPQRQKSMYQGRYQSKNNVYQSPNPNNNISSAYPRPANSNVNVVNRPLNSQLSPSYGYHWSQSYQAGMNNSPLQSQSNGSQTSQIQYAMSAQLPSFNTSAIWDGPPESMLIASQSPWEKTDSRAKDTAWDQSSSCNTERSTDRLHESHGDAPAGANGPSVMAKPNIALGWIPGTGEMPSNS